MYNVDYLVVGSGLTGATIARILTDFGKEVMVIDRRKHLGGNVSDHMDKNGVRIHTYGPHYFRTGSEKIWEYVNRFTTFYPYVACLQTEVDGHLYPWPIHAETLDIMVGTSSSRNLSNTAPSNFEEASLAMMPRAIYEKFVYGYTVKQWGVEPKQLSATLAKRFDVRRDGDLRLFRHAHQGMPSDGYMSFMRNMLAGIPLILESDFLELRDQFNARKLLIYTGPIDAYFAYKYGKLQYRGQMRETMYYSDIEHFQPVGQVNNPSLTNGGHIRTLEWKYMMRKDLASKVHGTVITRETPFTPEEPDKFEYPFPDDLNARLYQRYADEAKAMNKVLICGRMGEYRYYDMDQAIGRAMVLCGSILNAKD